MGTELAIMEIFYSIQGEGYHQGKAAWFVRLAGCDVGCVWCDVKDSWDSSNHPKLSVKEILEQLDASLSKIVIITGGEPCMQNLDALTAALKTASFQTHIETSGSHPISGQLDWITLSPKKFKSPLPEIHNLAHELKVVVLNKSDFDWAEKHAALANDQCKLFLQPEWDTREKVQNLVAEYIKSNPRWELSLQMHKYVNLP